MDKLTIEEVAARIDTIPTLSETYFTVSSMLENPKVSASEVSEEISRDPAITIKLLKIVNSAFYGLPQQVSTLTHALVLLGFASVKSLILAMSLSDIFAAEEGSKFPRRDFWIHCFGTGLIAKGIALRIGYRKVEEIFIQGLVHDVGKIVLDRYATSHYEEVLDLVEKEGILIREAEDRVLEFNHADVGARLLKQWNLPEKVCRSTAMHHSPGEEDSESLDIDIIHLADIIARAKGIGNGGDRRIPILSRGAWERLNISWTELEHIMEEAEGLTECEAFFR